MAFDIDTFAETSTAVTWGDIDLDAFRTDPLPETSLRALRYMCDVEYHTVCYLRDMLVTPSHDGQGEITTSRGMGTRPKLWNGGAPAQVLKFHRIEVKFAQPGAIRIKL